MRFLSAAAMALGVALAGSQAQAAVVLQANTTTDNAFYAYISTNDAVLGTLIGSGNSWPTTFSFTTALTPGVTNYLQIEAINYGGPGAFIGDFSLVGGSGFQFANGGQELVTDTTDWAGGINNGNSDPNQPQPWVLPTFGVESYGANGVGPWGSVAGVGPTAQWIWPSDPLSTDGCQPLDGGYCTVDLSTAITPTSGVPEPATWAMMLIGFGLVGLQLKRRGVVGAA
jgi:hypothetical protein